MSTTATRFALLVLVLSVVFAGCGGETAPETGSTAANTEDTTMAGDDDHSEFTFGEPADAADADRVIEMTASDDFHFDPASITVTAGEIVTFRVTNTGAIPHDFTLGDESTQQAHAEEMEEMAGMAMPDEPNAIEIGPGETRELTWHFTEPGSLLIGCHQVGHYEAGMKAEVLVEG